MVDPGTRVDWFKASILPHEAALRARLRRSSPSKANVGDLVSEAMVRAYGADNWHEIDDGRHHLFRVARNVLMDHAWRSTPVAFDSLAEGEQADGGTEAATSARDELRPVQRAIEAMPPQCRRVFVLRRVHERSAGEIATEMGLSISTVERHLGKAVALLARAIAAIEECSFGRPQDPQGEEHRLGRAASRFVAQFDDRGGAEAAERNAWLNADPRNAVAYARVSAAWDKAAALRSVAPAPDHDETRPVDTLPRWEGQDQQ